MQGTSFTASERRHLKDWYEGVVELDDNLIDGKLYDRLFAEMPYGVAKARDGDPHVWVVNKLSNMTKEQFLSFVES